MSAFSRFPWSRLPDEPKTDADSFKELSEQIRTKRPKAARRSCYRFLERRTLAVRRRFGHFYRPYARKRFKRLAAADTTENDVLLATRWLIKKHAVVAAEFRALEESLPKLLFDEIDPHAFLELGDALDRYVERHAFRFTEETLAQTINAWQEEHSHKLSLSETEAIAPLLRLLALDKLSRTAIRVFRYEHARNAARRFFLFRGPDRKRFVRHCDRLSRRHSTEYAVAASAAFHRILRDSGRPFQDNAPRQVDGPDGICVNPAAAIEADALLCKALDDRTRVLLRSLPLLGEFHWNKLLRKTNSLHKLLTRDPAGVYVAMTPKSQEYYRKQTAALAYRLRLPEETVAQAAVALAQQGEDRPRDHIGFYIVDRGLRQLVDRFRKTAPVSGLRLWNIVNRKRALRITYLTFVIAVPAAATVLLAVFYLRFRFLAWLAFPIIFKVSKHLIDSFFVGITGSEIIPQYRFPHGVPKESPTVFVIPALLKDSRTIRRLLGKLETAYLSNRDGAVSFCLLLDYTDADAHETDADAPLLRELRQAICELNGRYGETDRFSFFLRERIWSERQGRWMGWERKRGKLLDFARFLRHRTVSSRYVFSGTDVPPADFVITIDEDTYLSRDFVKEIVGIHAHPLHRPVVERGARRSGYTFVQPQVKQWFKNRHRFRLPRIFFDEKRFSAYAETAPEIYQDIFHEGSFSGKGCFHVDSYLGVLDGTLPRDQVLSHDLLEGSLARTLYASGLQVFDEFPSTLQALLARSHRWTRGDWQIIDWLFRSVRDEHGKRRRNTLRFIHQFKIFDNLIQSLARPSVLLLTIAAWWVDNDILLGFVLSLFFLELFLIDTVIDWLRWLSSLLSGHWRALWYRFHKTVLRDLRLFRQTLLEIVILPYTSLDTLHAIVVALWRRYVSGRNMLEWVASAHFQSASRRTFLLPFLFVAVVAVAFSLDRRAGPAIFLLIPVWALLPVFAIYLNRAYQTRFPFSSAESIQLRQYALETWRFFADHVTERTNHLPPDYVRFSPRPSTAHYTSITNIGFYLASIPVAVRFGFLAPDDALRRLRATLGTMVRLERYRGHFYNWYDTATASPAPPLFVSSVDSGNLIACLMTVRQWAERLRTGRETLPETPDMPLDDRALRDIAGSLDTLISDMRFDFLKSRKRSLISIGFHVPTRRLETQLYQTLASEARVTNLIALAQGVLSLKGWNKLNRKVVRRAGAGPAFISWTGTMFEYLMAGIFIEEYADSATGQSMRSAIRFNQRFARRKRIPCWGLSESAYYEFDRTGNYRYKPIGLPTLALSPLADSRPVASGYAIAMSLPYAPRAAWQCLETYAEHDGREERYGLIESIDFSNNPYGAPVRMCMSHHQGMVLTTLGNLFFDRFVSRLFESHPLVQNSIFVLDEILPPLSKEPFPQPTERYRRSTLRHPRTP